MRTVRALPIDRTETPDELRVRVLGLGSLRELQRLREDEMDVLLRPGR